MKELLNSFKTKKAWLRFALSIVLFLVVAFPCKFLTLTNISEVRPANAIPPVLALIWGLPAVIGTAVGNLFNDVGFVLVDALMNSNGQGIDIASILNAEYLLVCALGFVINIFYAYIPYKLWYTFRTNENDITPVFSNVGKILKYVVIILIDSLIATAMLSLVLETFYGKFGVTSGTNYIMLFFNNFDYAVILGIPVLLILEKYDIDHYIPKTKGGGNKYYHICDCCALASALLGIVWFIASSFTGTANSFASSILLACSILLLVPMFFKPYTFGDVQTQDKNRDIKMTIKAKFIIGFLLIAVVCIVFIGFTAYLTNPTDDFVALWNSIYTACGLAINAIFALAIAYLWYVERYIVKPLEDLTVATQRFADRRVDSEEIPTAEPISINTGDEISLLAESFNGMMTDITDYMENLKTVTAEKERIGAELDVATKIQASMLPCIFPAFPEREEFEVYATMDPAKEVGGDFYDFFMVDEDNLAIVVADVSGKGVPAALFMVIGKTLIKDHTRPDYDLGAVFTEVNDLLCESNSEGLFITAFEGVLNLKTGEFRFVNAGHEIPFICKHGGKFEPHKIRAGFVLAGMEGIKYRSGSIQLEVGDKIFQYTDGVTEATDINNKLYGMERLESTLGKLSNSTPEEILKGVKSDIDIFVGAAPQFDDITMLCLEYKSKMDNK